MTRLIARIAIGVSLLLAIATCSRTIGDRAPPEEIVATWSGDAPSSYITASKLDGEERMELTAADLVLERQETLREDV